MLGFIKKDLLVIKSNIKTLVIILVIYGLMIMTGKMDVFFLAPFLSMMLMLTTFSYDNYNKWDFYAFSLPNGRKNVVKAKYLTTFLIVVLMTIIAFIINLITINEKINLNEQFQIALGTVFGITLVQCFIYPLIFKLGIEKARIYIFILTFTFIFLIGTVIKFVNLSFLNNLSFLSNYIPLIFVIGTLLLLIISYKISVIIYN